MAPPTCIAVWVEQVALGNRRNRLGGVGVGPVGTDCSLCPAARLLWTSWWRRT